MALHPHVTKHLAKWITLFIFLASIVAAMVAWRGSDNPASQTSDNSAPQVTTPSTTVQPSFNKNQFPINEPDSVWVVVNKGRSLPSDYIPGNLAVPAVALSGSAASDNMHLRSDAAKALETLVESANNGGVKLMLVSGYRSYATQKSLYGGYVASQGQAYADATSARAGHSEHQTGLAADLGAASGKCQLEKCFGELAEGRWLANNAPRFGFIIRYEKDKQNLTGYDYEPWHLRFVGTELATEIHRSGQTIEQFFALTMFSDYPPQLYELKSVR